MNRNKLKRTGLLATLAAMALWTAACGGSEGNGSADAGQPSASAAAPASTAAAAPSASAASTPDTIKLDTQTLKNDSGKTMIKLLTTNTRADHHDSYAIVSSKGTVIVADPNEVPKKNGLIKADVITVSHTHSDHSDPDFLIPYLKKTVEGRVSRYAAESFAVKDVKVTGIPAMHSSKFDPAAPTDFIYLYEVDGLRIAHFGDLAQTELTQEQLDALGKVDVAILPFTDLGTYGFAAEKTIAFLKQLKPAIAMPGHYEPETAKLVLDEMKVTDRSESEELLLTREEVDAHKGTKYVLLK